MVKVVFASCPACSRNFTLVIPDEIQAIKPAPMEMEFRKEHILYNLLQYTAAYYITQHQCGVILCEKDTNHYMLMILDTQKWDARKFYSLNSKVLIEYFSGLLQMEVKEKDIDTLLDCVIWDDFKRRIGVTT